VKFEIFSVGPKFTDTNLLHLSNPANICGWNT